MWIRNLLNLERPNWDATDYFFKEDYTIVPKPRAVVYRDRYDQRKLMRLNEIHMVKDFHLFEYNKGMETRKWSEDDKRRSKDVPKPRAVVYRDRNDQRKLMRLNELHKFSDGTLTIVMEKLDQMVKDFHLYEYNKGMETRKWCRIPRSFHV
ncbi:hypothetical protein Tco_0258441 [Tanacetum coccineum]